MAQPTIAHLMHEVRSCLYPAKNRPAIVNFMGGLGARSDEAIANTLDEAAVTAAVAGVGPRRVAAR